MPAEINLNPVGKLRFLYLHDVVCGSLVTESKQTRSGGIPGRRNTAVTSLG